MAENIANVTITISSDEISLMLQEYTEASVQHFEIASVTSRSKFRAQDCAENMRHWAKRIACLPSAEFSAACQLPLSLCQSLQPMLQSGHPPLLDYLFFVLFLRGEYTKIIRLQQVTVYRDLLMIFTNAQHQPAENGVYYCSGQRLEPGEQFKVLEQAKNKTISGRRLRDSPNRPVLVIAHFYRKHWQAESIVDFPDMH